MSPTRAAAFQLLLFHGGAFLWALSVAALVALSGRDPASLNGLDQGLLGGLAMGGLGLWAGFVAACRAADGAMAWPTWSAARVTLAWRWPSWPGLAWSTLAGSTVWLLPTWALGQWVERTGHDSASIEALSRGMTEGPLAHRLTLMAAVVLVAPVAEEVVFRGLLWRILGPFIPVSAVFILTTLWFALYHGDPAQSVAVLPAGAAIGWLRWRTGSLAPAVAAHFANNAASLAALLVWGADGPSGPRLSWSLAGAAVAVFCCAVARPSRSEL
jgi:membrane protease YdiL (CAAX protease family)